MTCKHVCLNQNFFFKTQKKNKFQIKIMDLYMNIFSYNQNQFLQNYEISMNCYPSILYFYHILFRRFSDPGLTRYARRRFASFFKSAPCQGKKNLAFGCNESKYGNVRSNGKFLFKMKSMAIGGSESSATIFRSKIAQT